MCGCVSSYQQVSKTTMPPTNSTIDYNSNEVQCAKNTINKLYTNAERYGNDVFVFHYQSSDAWNDYLGCLIKNQQKGSK